MSHVLFNRSYIAQALWVEPEEIKEIRILNRKAAEVTLSIDGKKHKTIVKDKEVKRYLIAARKERAKNIEIQEVDPAMVIAKNPIKGTEYRLYEFLNFIQCECADWKNLSIWFDSNEVCCKHAFALLNYLGYKSLSEYQKEQWEAEEADRAFWQDYRSLAYMSM